MVSGNGSNSMKTNRLIVIGGLASVMSVPGAAQTWSPFTSAGEQAKPAAATQAPDKNRRVTRRPSTIPAKVTVLAGPAQKVPQVVTIVHRLSGVKMLRLFLRQAGERGTQPASAGSMLGPGPNPSGASGSGAGASAGAGSAG